MLSKPFAKVLSALSLLLALAPSPAKAIPVLQLYIEGATYDASSETWLAGGLGPVRLWAIGNVNGPGGMGPIGNVRLSAAYQATTGPVTIGLTPSTTGGFGGFLDPSTSPAPTFIQSVTNGSAPLLPDGSSLPSHGIFGPGTHWREFGLGNFTLTDSPMADFIVSFPSTLFPGTGQINVYEVSVTGTSAVHFDLYDTVTAANHAKFAPFSHDAEVPEVPEPAPLALIAIGILALVLIRRRIA